MALVSVSIHLPTVGSTAETRCRGLPVRRDAYRPGRCPRARTPSPTISPTRMGCGAMQLAAPHVFGPPADREGAVALLREVVALGITHIDTSDYYGPHVTNQIIREALRPYPADLRTVTEDGARCGDQSGRPQALALKELRQAAHENLTNLRLETLDVVKLRAGRLDSPTSGSVAESLRFWRRCNSRGFRAPRASTVTAGRFHPAPVRHPRPGGQPGCTPSQWRSPWLGCCSAHRTSC